MAKEKTGSKNSPKTSSVNSLLKMVREEPLETVVLRNMGERDKSSALLMLVSRRLFFALSALVALGTVIVAAMFWSGQEGNITLPAVLFFGVLGGFIGIQRRLKDLTLHDLEILSMSRIYLYLSPLVGGLLAIILYIMFISGLIEGGLFPKFTAGSDVDVEALGFTSIFKQYAEHGHLGYAKLMFWSFVSGFSEKFVTDVIGKFEGRAVKDIDAPNQEPRKWSGLISVRRLPTAAKCVL